MIDHETLIWSLLTRDMPMGAYFDSETNIAEDFELPMPALIYSLSNSGQTQNGPNLWTGQLDVTILGKPADAWARASAVYDMVHGWATNGVIPDVGWVQDLTDISAFSQQSFSKSSRTPSVNIVGKGVNQYAGSFALALRN